MPSDQQISILFDIASDGGAGLASSKLPDLMDLVADGQFGLPVRTPEAS